MPAILELMQFWVNLMVYESCINLSRAGQPTHLFHEFLSPKQKMRACYNISTALKQRRESLTKQNLDLRYNVDPIGLKGFIRTLNLELGHSNSLILL